jgi:hypothetical protein
MKMNLKFLAIGVLLIGFTVSANAQTNSVNADANAVVVKALTITKQQNLSFGTFAGAAAVATNVIIAPGGDRSGSADLIASAAGAAAAFTITGQANGVVTVTFPATPIEVADQAGADPGVSMAIMPDSWLSDLADIALTSLGGTGVKTFNLGAQLEVAANQQAGTYKGTFSVFVNYN